MLPPCFWALAGLANKAMPDAATRKTCANTRERIAAFIDASSKMPYVRYSGSLVSVVGLAGIPGSGKGGGGRRMKSPTSCEVVEMLFLSAPLRRRRLIRGGRYVIVPDAGFRETGQAVRAQ